MKALYLVFAMIFSAAAYAGDTTIMRPLGFSPTGSYYAFVTYGIADGSGAAYAKAVVVDVEKNAFAKVSSFSETDNGDEFEGDVDKVIAQAVAGVQLSKFNIVPGQNMGEDLLIRLNSDKSAYSDTTFSISGDVEGGAGPTFRRYQLFVTETPAGSSCYGLKDGTLLKLTLKGEDVGSGILDKVLQEDAKLPKVRECASDYAVERVTVFKSALVVGVKFQSLGFEGPNLEHMVVTARESLN